MGDVIIERTQKEIDDLEGRCAEAEAEGSAYPGMTYEQGILAALRWLVDAEEPDPMDD